MAAPESKCRLKLPWPKWAEELEGAAASAVAKEDENYKTLERWADHLLTDCLPAATSAGEPWATAYANVPGSLTTSQHISFNQGAVGDASTFSYDSLTITGETRSVITVLEDGYYEASAYVSLNDWAGSTGVSLFFDVGTPASGWGLTGVGGACGAGNDGNVRQILNLATMPGSAPMVAGQSVSIQIIHNKGSAMAIDVAQLYIKRLGFQSPISDPL